MEKKTREQAKRLMRDMPTTLRGNVTTYLPLSEFDHSTAEGLSKNYFYVALGYRNDAKILHDRDPQFGGLGKYMLAFHALEVGLKSFLAKKGLSENELSRRPFGHDLTALYEEAVLRGLDLKRERDVRATIDHTNRYHYKAEAQAEDEGNYYALRYDAGLKVLTSCAAVLEVICGLGSQRSFTANSVSKTRYEKSRVVKLVVKCGSKMLVSVSGATRSVSRRTADWALAANASAAGPVRPTRKLRRSIMRCLGAEMCGVGRPSRG
jgi:hypothetical protein